MKEGKRQACQDRKEEEKHAALETRDDVDCPRCQREARDKDG
jgi:hypothetical protein